MKQIATLGIVLHRTNYGEADRILTIITPDHGKLRLMAKGVRKIKSKLAGGIELFSVSNITFIRGRGDIAALISTRLNVHYEMISQDIDRTMLGYTILKLINKVTEDEAEKDWFYLLKQSLEALNDTKIDKQVIKFWFQAQMLRISGYSPELHSGSEGVRLDPALAYRFDFETMSFSPSRSGAYTAEHIKYLRLAFSAHLPKVLSRVRDTNRLANKCSAIVEQMLQLSMRI